MVGMTGELFRVKPLFGKSPVVGCGMLRRQSAAARLDLSRPAGSGHCHPIRLPINRRCSVFTGSDCRRPYPTLFNAPMGAVPGCRKPVHPCRKLRLHERRKALHYSLT
jgi:hypothetical protein